MSRAHRSHRSAPAKAFVDLQKGGDPLSSHKNQEQTFLAADRLSCRRKGRGDDVSAARVVNTRVCQEQHTLLAQNVFGASNGPTTIGHRFDAFSSGRAIRCLS